MAELRRNIEAVSEGGVRVETYVDEDGPALVILLSLDYASPGPATFAILALLLLGAGTRSGE